MSEQLQSRAVEPRADGTRPRSSSPPRPAARQPLSTTPMVPPAGAVAMIAPSPPQVPGGPPPNRGSTPPPVPVRTSVLPPLPLPPPARAIATVPSHQPLPLPPAPAAGRDRAASAAPVAAPGDTREELRRLVGQANDALVSLQTVVREIERRLASLDAGPLPQGGPASSDAPGSNSVTAGSALRRLASRLVDAIGRLARAWLPTKLLSRG